MNTVSKILFVLGVGLLCYLTVKDSHSEQVDVTEILKVELKRLTHKHSLEIIEVMKEYLPAILEQVAQELRYDADQKFKCSLLKDTAIKDDC